MKLTESKMGAPARIISTGGEGAVRQHLLDMGLIPGAEVTAVKAAPMGDPLEVSVYGYYLSLRKEEADRIVVEPLPESVSPDAGLSRERDFGYNLSLHEHNSHPGYGEEGKYHSRDHENPLPKGTVLRIALVGQHNTGKTMLFNRLTGDNRHVGNFPGVTMERKDGPIKDRRDAVVTDLPGMYSLSAYTSEEFVARRNILNDTPHAIINIVDANNIERNLYLTVQLMELGVPMVLAINMMDELRSGGGSIRVNEMEKILGLPVVPVASSSGEGVAELIDHAVHIARYKEAPVRQDFCDKEDGGGAVHRCLHGIMHLIEDHAEASGIPVRFAADRLVEGDEEVLESLKLDENEREMLEHIVLEMEDAMGMDRHAAMAGMRYSFINRLCSRTVVKPKETVSHRRSLGLDRVLTGKWTAVPSFLAIIGVVFYMTFNVAGLPLQGLIASLVEHAGGAVDAAFSGWGVSDALRSLVVDALFGGVGYVLSFVPVIVVLFFFLSLLEDSGYMARVAFLSDKLLRRIGLSGRSVVPMLIGFGCSVPAVMSARTLPSARDRKKTILLIPFMSCSAKISIYAFFSAAFFPSHAAVVMAALYLLGILVGILVALASKRISRSEGTAPFVMELPPYRLPVVGNVAHLLWDKVKDFVKNAFSVILFATVIIWALQSFDFRFRLVSGGEGSILSWIAGLIAPVFAPLGLGDWRVVTALISGFLAKESVVSSVEMLGATSLLTPLSAVSIMVFCLLYTPCVASVAAIRKELGGRWALFVIVFQCAVAWVCAWLAFLVAGLFL